MRKGNKKLFIDQEKLYKMVNLRILGWPVNGLAIMFVCDRSSVREQLQKYNISPRGYYFQYRTIITPVIKAHFKPDEKWKTIDGFKFNKGKRYEDYIKETKARISPYKNRLTVR